MSVATASALINSTITPTIAPTFSPAPASFFAAPPAATLIIMAIAIGIAFLNTGINRLLINHFLGWTQYRVMQKETNEYRAEMMKAMRANDKKQLEKLKKRDAQIKAMQAKMMKPQFVQIAVSFLYIFVWILVLTPTFGTTTVAYIPGLAPGAILPTGIPVLYWYPICSMPFGILASRLIGVLPIE
jgi:uncharacterized membrane protein (DUF106 family)